MRLAIALLGVVAAFVLAGCAGGGRGDTDLFPAEDQEAGWDVTVTRLDGATETFHSTSDPGREDTDSDGVLDFTEFVEGTHARRVDTDGDGLIDGDTQSLDADSRKARVWVEAGLVYRQEAGRLVFSGERTLHTDPRHQDSDGDGLMDGEEVRGYSMDFPWGTRVVRPDPFQLDSDDDTLPDDFEIFTLGTDPTRSDTEGDGVPDWNDLMPLGDLGFDLVLEEINPKGTTGQVYLGLFLAGQAGGVETGRAMLGGGSDWVSGSAMDLDGVDADDAGALPKEARWNLTVAVFAFLDQAGNDRRLDVGSQVSGTDGPTLRLDVQSGALWVEQPEGEPVAYDPQRGLEGDDLAVRLALRAVDLGVAAPS